MVADGDQQFWKAAAQIGQRVFDPDEAVSWPEHGDGNAAAVVKGEEGTCGFLAQCELGCPRGAKRSMDRTYLAQAERLGVQVRTGALVSHVGPVRGGYAVFCRSVATGEAYTVSGRRVVLAAGTLGTNEILLRSYGQSGTLPRLSSTWAMGSRPTGTYFLGSIQNSATDLDPSHGPDVTSVMRFFDASPGFMATPTFSAPVMRVLASFGQPTGKWFRPVGGTLWRALPCPLPLAFSSGLLARPAILPSPNRGDPRRMTNLFCIGRDNAGGQLRLERNPGRAPAGEAAASVSAHRRASFPF